MVSKGRCERLRVPLPDGGWLAATLYLPAGISAADPQPCLLEALPYRKDDLTAGYRPEYERFRDEHGYAVARVDLRGTGSSPGLILDEYHPQEQADLHAVIGWLAGRPWCTGAVGMFGTSWSGFNALQLACERPPALRAVVASYATDDRWSDDVHYMGGSLRLLDLVDYPLYMVTMAGLPPVPELFGEGWRDEWRRRAEGTPPWLVTWLEQQADGPYWRHGSVRAHPGPAGQGTPSYERIAVPTMLIAGWADGYRNNSFRTVRALAANGTAVSLLAGPWSHMAPSSSVPGPWVDHVPVMARWWDRWLRDEPNGVDGEPACTVFVRRYAEPEPDAAGWPGGWQALDPDDLPGLDRVLPLAAGHVTGGERDGAVVTYRPAGDVGVTAWNSCAGSLPWGQPEDQTPDDTRSLCVEWPVEPGTVVVGQPRLRLRVRPDHPVCAVSAKLSLLPAGGGPSLLVDRGFLNLSYRDGDPTTPRPCVPGEWVDVEVELEATAFEAATTDGGPVLLRLALACEDWPNTTAAPGTWSAVDLAASSLLLPVSAGSRHPAPVLPAPAPQPEVKGEGEGEAGEGHVVWRHGWDVLARRTFAEVDHGSRFAGEFGSGCVERYVGRVEVDPRTRHQAAVASARYELTWPCPDGAPDVAVTSEARLDLQVDDDTFHLTLELDVDDAGAPFVRRRWQHDIPRHLA
jgi:uncharacterized protein